MVKSLRERQKEMVRESIFAALAEEVAETGTFDFSIGEVAKRAGVSHRTVYNYFESRQDLIDAFSSWTDDTIHERGGVIVPGRLEDLPAAVTANFQIFEAQSAIAEVLARMDTPERATSAHRRRTEAFEESIAAVYPKMDPRSQRVVAVLFRQIASVRNWYFMTREHGLNTKEAAAVSAWALDRLRTSLEHGDLPQLDGGV